MKRAWWVFRIAALVAASYCIFTPSGSYTLREAQAAGCETSQTCARNSQSNCYCPVVILDGKGCEGCFVPNNSSGCGTCSGGAMLNE